MASSVRWFHSLAWKFFLRQGVAVLVLMGAVLGVAYDQAEKGAARSAEASLAASGQVLEQTFLQQGRTLDAGLQVFTQTSTNLAYIEKALEVGSSPSLKDTLVENLPRLGAQIAVLVKPDGGTLAATGEGLPSSLGEVGIVQMALDPEGARAAGYPGPYYRGFLRVESGRDAGVFHAVARPIRSLGGASLGAMVVGTRLDGDAARDLRRVAIAPPRKGDPPAHLALLSHFSTLGTTLAQGEGLDRLLARDPAFLLARAQVLDRQGSSVLPLVLEGRPYLGLILPLRGVNALDLEMAQGLLLPKDPLLAPFRTLLRAILVAGFAGILAALLAALHSARAVTAPLEALTAASAALAEGQRPEHLPLVRTQDEVGALSRALGFLLEDLRAKEDLLAWLEKARTPSRAPETFAGISLGEISLHPLPGAGPGGGTSGTWAGTVPPGLREGAVFAGRYRVDGVLGQGGMGVVLRVRDLHLEEDVALKVLRAELAGNERFLEQLKMEIRLARRITHRHVLRTHDFGVHEGIPYVTMEYLKGVTLRKLLDDRGRLPLPLILRIGRQVAEGLEAAHAVEVVHRDIKPLNVLFDTRGDAKIMDFGLAAPVSARGAGLEDQVFGTPRYMSPEQVRGERVDPRADLYAFGVMLYELSTGMPPYDSPSMGELLEMHLKAPVPPLLDQAPDLPGAFGELVERLMAKRRDARPQSAAEVVETLKVLAAGDPGTRRLRP